MKTQWKKSDKSRIYFYVVFIFFGLLYGTTFIANHYFFRSTTFDYGTYNFAFYDYSHFRISPCPVYRVFSEVDITFLQDHFSLTLMYFVPFYWLITWLTGSYTLLLIQMCFILWGAYAIYKLIELKSKDQNLALGSMIFFFLLQAHFTSFSSDCNIVIICANLIPVFLYYFEAGKKVAALLIFLLAIFSREDISLWFVFIFTVLMIQHRKDRRLLRSAFIYLVASVVYFIVLFKAFIPAVQSPDRSYDLFTYSALGSNPFEALRFILQHPVDTAKLLFVNHSGNPVFDGVKTEFYLVYLLSGGFLLFFRPHYFIWFVPLIAQKMFNDVPIRWSIELYYSLQVATLLPVPVFLIIAKVRSVKLKYSLAALVCILAGSVTAYKMDAGNRKMPVESTLKENLFDPGFFRASYHAGQIHRHLSMIPKNAAVSASESILPHLSQRESIYLFPHVEDAEYIAAFSTPDFYMVTNGRYNAEFYKYVFSPDWTIIAESSTFMLFKKQLRDAGDLLIIQDSLYCDSETLSENGNHFMASDGQLIDNGNTRDSSIAWSGKYAAMLTKDSPYGMTFRNKKIQSGDILRVSVWRYPANANNGFLVISSGNDFYQSSGDITSTIENGWGQVVLYATVPDNHEDFGIYLWNTGQDPVWFDDLVVQKYR